MSLSVARRVRTMLLVLALGAGLLALAAPLAQAADAGGQCPAAACVVDDGTDNMAAPDEFPGDEPEEIVEPEEISDDAEDLAQGDDGGEGTATISTDASDDEEAGSNVDAQHPIGDAWSEAPRGLPADAAGAAAGPMHAAVGDGAYSGELPFTGTGAPIALLAAFGLLLVIGGLLLRMVGVRRRAGSVAA